MIGGGDAKAFKKAEAIMSLLAQELPQCYSMHLEHPDPNTWEIYTCADNKGREIAIENNYYLLSHLTEVRELFWQPRHFSVSFNEGGFALIDRL